MSNCIYAGTEGAYVIDLAKTGASHNDLVTIATTATDGLVGRAFIKVNRPYSFSGFSSPVLLRVTGPASGFRLENLAPSIAAGVQRNFQSQRFSFLALNGIATVYSLPDESYALSLGAAVDFGAYVQIGSTYHTKDKKWYAILGLRPETLLGLIPRLAPKS